MKRNQIKKRPLSDTVIASLEPESRTYQEKDSKNLYLNVKPSGAKSWMMRYKDANGKWRWHGIGAYPHVTGAMARKLVLEKQHELALGAPKLSRQTKSSETLSDIATIWLKEPAFTKLAPNSQARYLVTLNKHILPSMGSQIMRDISRDAWLKFFKKIQSGTHHQSGKAITTEAFRAWRLCNRIYSFAMNEQLGGVEANPLAGLDERLLKVETKPMPHVSAEQLPKLLYDITQIQSTTTRIGLLLVAHLFLRSQEVLDATWSEINWNDCTLEVPAWRMKMRRVHTVPLSRQVMELLRELHAITGDGEYLFPSRAKTRKLARLSFYMALRRLGYAGSHTLHGFRHVASTCLNDYTDEHGNKFDERVIEIALAHKAKGVRAVYNKAQYLHDRRALHQWYSDWLDAQIKKAGN